ncbi:hypothetical protein ACFX5K_03310 [Rickettsiales bacterium LUAb2]
MIARINEVIISNLVLGIVLVSVLLNGTTIVQAKDNTIWINNVNSNDYNKSSTIQYYAIKLIYQNVIDGKGYNEEVTLLREQSWLDSNGIHKAGDTMVLSMPEFGVINAKATAREVKVSSFNPDEAYSKEQPMVTGIFKHYSNDVREYTLKDHKTGVMQTIEVTPNHAFYVKNRTAFNKALNQYSHFIAIEKITPADHMLNEAGNAVELVCQQHQITVNKGNTTYNCFKQLVTNHKPLLVYNLEIYKQHQYLVASNKNITPNRDNYTHTITNNTNNSTPLNIAINNAILVHNACVGQDMPGFSGDGGDDPNWNRPIDPQDPLGKKKAANARYSKTEKGKATNVKYRRSEKGKATRAAYEQSEQGKANRRRYKESGQSKIAYNNYYQSGRGKVVQTNYRQTEQGKATIVRGRLAQKAKKLGFTDFNSALANEFINAHGGYESYAKWSRTYTADDIQEFLDNREVGALPDVQDIPEVLPIANPMADFDAFFDGAIAGNEADLGTDPIIPLLSDPLDLDDIELDDFD